jgi:hypothetical protein
VQLGAGRTPLIIAGVAALVTYAAFGSQTPFAFLHNLGHHKHTITVISTSDADEAVAEAREEAAEAAAEAKEAAAEARETSSSHSETREVAAFDSIVLEDGAAADIKIGDTQSVEFKVPGGHGEGVKTDVRDGALVVAGMGPALHLQVTVPHLRDLRVNGPSKVSIEGLKEPISVTANGPSRLSANGSVDSIDLTINGPGKLAFTDLVAKNVLVHLNGVGDAEVNATQSLTADIEGVGKVRYMGEPHVVSTIHGPGTVKRIADAG